MVGAGKGLVKNDSCISAFLSGLMVVSFGKIEATTPGLGTKNIGSV